MPKICKMPVACGLERFIIIHPCTCGIFLRCPSSLRLLLVRRLRHTSRRTYCLFVHPSVAKCRFRMGCNLGCWRLLRRLTFRQHNIGLFCGLLLWGRAMFNPFLYSFSLLLLFVFTTMWIISVFNRFIRAKTIKSQFSNFHFAFIYFWANHFFTIHQS